MTINILIKTQIFKVSKKWTVGVKKMDSCKLSFDVKKNAGIQDWMPAFLF